MKLRLAKKIVHNRRERHPRRYSKRQLSLANMRYIKHIARVYMRLCWRFKAPIVDLATWP